MTITTRQLKNDEDYWRVHRLLIETYPITPLGFNWEIRRWEGQRFHNTPQAWPPPRLHGRVQLWETSDGQMVGAVHPEGEGDAHLQVHPDFRQLEAEMITWAEEHLTKPSVDSHRQLEIFVFEYDTHRQALLAARGYVKSEDGGVVRRLQLRDQPPPEPKIAPGYALRTTNPGDLSDCQRIAELLNAAFNRDFHNALEFQNFTQHAPCFRPELDLVAVAPDGSFASYVGIAYDEANQLGIFEPVCTHPNHRRHGLAKALMQEGLKRLHGLDAKEVTVGTGDMIPANWLYDSIGFTDVVQGYTWRRLFD